MWPGIKIFTARVTEKVIKHRIISNFAAADLPQQQLKRLIFDAPQTHNMQKWNKPDLFLKR